MIEDVFPDDMKMFVCPTHLMVIVTTDGEMSSRGTPGSRDPSCGDCDKAVKDACDHIGLFEKEPDPCTTQ